MASQALQLDPERKPMETSLEHLTTTHASVDVDENEIAVRAYELWHERGRPLGSPQEDWFRAEQELKSRNPKATAA